MCIMFLLLAVAFAGATASPAPADSPDPFSDPLLSPNPGDPEAAARIQHAHESCYKTVTGVERKCARQFLRAVFTGKKVTDFAITTDCCHRLACVREDSCADVLNGVCVPPGRDVCPPPQATPAAAMARESSATATIQ
jgi:hypothetical protein